MWTMWAQVVRFQSISGEHSGHNLRQYFFGLCEHVGILNKEGLKVGVTEKDNIIVRDSSSTR